MNKVQVKTILFITMLLYGCTAYAQDIKAVSADSLKSKFKKALQLDTAAMKKTFDFESKIKNTASQKIKQSPLNKMFKKDSAGTNKKVQLKDFSVQTESQYTQTSAGSPFPKYAVNTGFSGQLTLFKLPVNLDVVKTYSPVNDLNLTDNNLFKFGFAKEQLYQLYQGDLDKYKNFKKDKLAGLNMEGFLRKGLRERIQHDLPDSIAGSPKVKAFISNPKAINELLSLNEEQLKQKLTTVLTSEKGKLKGKADSIYNDQRKSADGQVQAKVSELTGYVQTVKKEMNDSGLDPETIGLMQKFAENKISKKDLQGFYTSQLNRRPELKGVQNFYSRIKEFQVGNFGHKLPGAAMNQDLFLNGVNFSLKTLRGSVSGGVAGNKDGEQPKDAGFDKSTFSYPKMYTFLSVPTANFAAGSGQLSWVGVYDKQFSKSLNEAITLVPRNNLVFTLSQNLHVKNLGKITVDLSKSATQYRNLTTIGPDQLFMDKNTNGNYFKDDFLETMSLGINHGIDAKKLGLNSNVYFNYSGLGFQNASQQGLTSMNMRYGGNIKQNLFRNKVTLYLKSDLKNSPISAAKGEPAENVGIGGSVATTGNNDQNSFNAHWKNYNVQLDSRFRISKGYTLNVKYIENGVSKITDIRTAVYASKKIQTDFNANYKIGGHYSFSHITLGKQMVSNVGSIGQPNFMTLNYAQTVLFKDFSLVGNLFYNRELNTVIILGNMVNSDVACQFTLFKKISLSSGVTYLDNQNIAKQVGFKQNVQMMLKKHFDVSAYVDVRKNLINPMYPDLFSTGRAEFSIRYYLDKQ